MNPTSNSAHPSVLALVAFAACLTIAVPASAGDVAGPLVDREGDVHDPQNGGGPLADLASIDISHDGETVRFELTTFTAITPPSMGLASALVGMIDFDVDQDPSTGLPAVQNQWSPPFTSLVLGGERALALGSEFFNPGLMRLLGPDGSVIAMVPVTYTTHGVSGEFPLSLIDDEAGAFDFTTTIGNPFGPNDAVEAVGTSYFHTCDADLDGDGIVGVGDLTALILAWGTDAGDVTGDGTTDVSDLTAVITAWGLCD
ncbi:MAG: hypothetical protein ACYTGR_11640 [Planctomycetota bacterium]|jgi:hypothetical protein